MTKPKDNADLPPATPETAPDQPVGAPRAGSKQALLCDLLGRDGGASLDEITAATQWLAHTARAALTGLRKRGHTINKAKVDGVTRYSIEAPK